MLEKDKFYKVKNYTYEERLEFNSNVPLYILVKTKKTSVNNSNEVFQSDYENLWDNRKNLNSTKKNILSKYYKNFRNTYTEKLKNLPFFVNIFSKKQELKFYKKKNFLKSKFITRFKI